MANGVVIKGLEECLRTIESSPAEMTKIVKTAMRKGSQASRVYIRSKVPDRYKKLIRYKVANNRRTGAIGAQIGFYSRKEIAGHQPTGKSERDKVYDWFKAYWSNYGTLSKRDQTHSFDRKRKARSREWRGGIRPRRFFEGAYQGHEARFLEAFEKSMDKQIREKL